MKIPSDEGCVAAAANTAETAMVLGVKGRQAGSSAPVSEEQVRRRNEALYVRHSNGNSRFFPPKRRTEYAHEALKTWYPTNPFFLPFTSQMHCGTGVMQQLVYAPHHFRTPDSLDIWLLQQSCTLVENAASFPLGEMDVRMS